MQELLALQQLARCQRHRSSGRDPLRQGTRLRGLALVGKAIAISVRGHIKVGVMAHEHHPQTIRHVAIVGDVDQDTG